MRVLNKLKQDFNASQEDVVKWAQDGIFSGFEALEKRLVLRAGQYAYGATITLADICIVPQVYNAYRFGVDMSHFPTLEKVFNNCQLLEAFIKAAPENQIDAT
mgnify:CR=1 FL=1